MAYIFPSFSLYTHICILESKKSLNRKLDYFTAYSGIFHVLTIMVYCDVFPDLSILCYIMDVMLECFSQTSRPNSILPSVPWDLFTCKNHLLFYIGLIFNASAKFPITDMKPLQQVGVCYISVGCYVYW